MQSNQQTFFKFFCQRFKADITPDDSQRRFLAKHSVAMLEQRCNYSKQCRNNIATMCCAKNHRWESSSCNITFIQIALCAQEEVTSHMTGRHKPRFVEPHVPQPRISCRFNSRTSWTPSSAMIVEKVNKKFYHWFYKVRNKGFLFLDWSPWIPRN